MTQYRSFAVSVCPSCSTVAQHRWQVHFNLRTRGFQPQAHCAQSDTPTLHVSSQLHQQQHSLVVCFRPDHGISQHHHSARTLGVREAGGFSHGKGCQRIHHTGAVSSHTPLALDLVFCQKVHCRDWTDTARLDGVELVLYAWIDGNRKWTQHHLARQVPVHICIHDSASSWWSSLFDQNDRVLLGELAREPISRLALSPHASHHLHTFLKPFSIRPRQSTFFQHNKGSTLFKVDSCGWQWLESATACIKGVGFCHRDLSEHVLRLDGGRLPSLRSAWMACHWECHLQGRENGAKSLRCICRHGWQVRQPRRDLPWIRCWCVSCSGLFLKPDFARLASQLLLSYVDMPPDIIIQKCLMGDLPECSSCSNSLVTSKTLLMYHIGYNTSTSADRVYRKDEFQCGWRHPFNGNPSVVTL